MAQEPRRAYVSDYDDGTYDETPERRTASRPPTSSHLPPPPAAARDYVPTPRAGRSRAPSNAPPPTGSQSQPLRPVTETVDSAYDAPAPAPAPETSSQVDPDLVAQITQSVIANLKLSGMMKEPQADYDNPPLSARSTAPPPQSFPPQNVATPSYSDRFEGSNVDTTSPDVRDYKIDQGRFGRDVPDYSSRYGGEGEESPRHLSPQRSQTSRPPMPAQEPSDDTTILEKIWQPLFDDRSRGTPRLGQFLRGLAIHIITEYEPRQSLVVTPQKMLKFYNDIKVPDEIYPWQQVFDGTMSYANLSYLYRDLQCEHFFVQEKPHERPIVPALTPHGFAAWMTHVIRAHPDHEYKRFTDAVLNLPISNADDPKERFPKELSRRLFPAQPNTDMQDELEDSIREDKNVKMPRRTTTTTSSSSAQPPPLSETPRRSTTSSTTRPHIPPLSTSTSMPPSSSSAAQSQAQYDSPRKPTSANTTFYDPTSTSSADIATSTTSTSTSNINTNPPIERERKPYSAQPGIGKVYSRGESQSQDLSSGSGANINSTTFVSSSAPGSAPGSAPPTPRTSTIPGGLGGQQRPDIQPRQMSDVPEESPSSSTTKLASLGRTSSTARHSSSNAARVGRSSSLAGKGGQGQQGSGGGGGGLSRSESDMPSSQSQPQSQFPPSSYTSGSNTRDPWNRSGERSRDRDWPTTSSSGRHDRDRNDRNSRDRDLGRDRDFERDRERDRNGDRSSEEELGRRYSKSSDEAPRERTRRYTSSGGNGGGGGGSGGYKAPSRQHSSHEDEYYPRGRRPLG